MDNTEYLFAKYMNLNASLLNEGHNPLGMAAVLMTQALSIYKTVLPSYDYDKMIEHIVDCKDAVKTFEVNGNALN